MPNNTVQNLDPIDMQSWEPDKLLAKAKELGVTIDKKTTDAAEIIASIVEAMADQTSTNTEPEVGQLVSLHSRTDGARELILAARNRIHANADQNRTFKLFLQDREGNFYQRPADGVRVSRARMPEVLEITTPLPDGSQESLLKDYKDNPESFQEPLLVRLRRKNGDGESYGHYVMLYLRRKQENMAEQVF